MVENSGDGWCYKIKKKYYDLFPKLNFIVRQQLVVEPIDFYIVSRLTLTL